MQTLRDKNILKKMKIPLVDAFRGVGIIKNILFVSHRWEEPDQPDVDGEQLNAIKAYLGTHKDIEWVWFDYSSMPQRFNENGLPDCRNPKEKAEFELMLSLIADLYLTAHVLILLDSSYASRFWTLTEAWCSMQTATPEGLLSNSDMSQGEGELGHELASSDPTELRTQLRYTIACIHNAADKHREALKELVATKTPSQMVQILKKPDVNVTNQKDKKAMLPKIETMNRRVVETFEMLKTIAETEVHANDTQQVSASGAKFRPTGEPAPSVEACSSPRLTHGLVCQMA